MRTTPRTKAGRLEMQANEFNRLTAAGWQRETYKGLNIFTNQEEVRGGQAFGLKVFRGTAAAHIQFSYYRSQEQRDKSAQGYRDSYDRQEAYKEEAKKNPTHSTAANCAAAIREELKKKFAGVKFTVRSSNFAGGDSVHIDWHDGPTSKEVEEITSKYQYGHFNGMEDIYEYSNDRNDIPQAKYVQEGRRMSEATRATLDSAAVELMKDREQWENNTLHRVFSQTSLPAGAIVTGLERTEVTCGSLEEFYRITYTGGTTPTEPRPEAAEVPAGSVQVIEYGKGIAVIGDTRPIKDKLKALGGRFNFRLTCGPGWVFQRSALERITAALAPTEPEPLSPDEERENADTYAEEVRSAHQEDEEQPTRAEIDAADDRQQANPASPYHFDKVSAASIEARQIIRSVNGVVKEAAAGRVSSAQAMEEAAAKIERIDTPKAAETAATLRQMAQEHRAKMAAAHIPEDYEQAADERPRGYLTRDQVREFNTLPREERQRRMGTGTTAEEDRTQGPINGAPVMRISHRGPVQNQLGIF